MRLSLLLAPALLCCATTARADTRIAYSQRLGLEVLADGPAWCTQTPGFRVVGQSRQTFLQPELPALIQRVGGLIAGQCPAATGAAFAGSVQSSPDVVWRGKAGLADGWVLHVADAGLAAPPTPATATGAVAATVPLPVASPFLGEWVGATGCNARAQVAVAISVSEVDGPAAQAVVQVAPQQGRAQQGMLRFQADGSFDAASGQFVLRPGSVIRANGEQPQQITGTIDGRAGTMTLQDNCYGNAAVTKLSRVSQDPALARRVAEDRTRRTEWAGQAADRPKAEGRLVGALPRGTPRQPSCPELLAWAASSPLDLRVRLQDTGGEAVLRQYDDQNSARVFGVPAYYWITLDENGRRQQAVNPREVASRACAPADQRDPRYSLLMQVAGDGTSMNALVNRRRTDDLVDALPARVATTGGTAAEMYADLAPLTRPESVAAAFQAMTRSNQQSLTPANQAQLMSEALRLRGLLAARALDEARSAIAAAPQTPEGLARVGQVVSAFKAEFGDDAAAEAGDARRADIAGTLATAAAARLEASPRTLAGLAAARQTATAARAELGRDLPDGGAAIDAALQRYQDAAVPEVLSAETAALAAVPATPDGAKALAERRAKVLDTVGMDAAGGYRAAVDARLAAAIRAREPELQTALAGLDASWASVGTARAMGRDAAQAFGDSPAAAALRDHGEARAAAIVEALGSKAVAAIHAAPGDSILQIVDMARGGDAAARPFEQDPAGKGQAEQVRKAVAQRAGDLAEGYLPAYRARLASASLTGAVTRKLAAAWVILDRVLKPRVPAFGRYAEPTREAALRVQGAACDQAATELGLSSSDAKLPMMLGNRISTLGAFACAMRDTGVRHGKLAAPSGGGDYTFKMFVPAGSGSADSGKGGPAGAATRGGVSEDPFVFTEPAVQPGPARDDDIDDVRVLMLRMVEIGVDRKALVGVQVGDEAKMQALSVPEWRQVSAGMIAGGQHPAVDAETCASFAADPARLSNQAAADALLGCARKS